MTQPTCASDAPKSSLMRGIATFTIELLSTETKTAEVSTARRRRVVVPFSPSGPPTLKPRPPLPQEDRHQIPSLTPSKIVVLNEALLLRGEAGVQVGPHLREKQMKCPALPCAHTRKSLLLNPLPAAGDGLLERASLNREVDPEAPRVPRVPAPLHEAAPLEVPQHLGYGGWLDPEPLGELAASQAVLIPQLHQHHLLPDVEPELRQPFPYGASVLAADLRQRVARSLLYQAGPDHWPSLPTERLLGSYASGSRPHSTMRSGKSRITSASNPGPISSPPSPKTSARPLTSTPRARHGGNTSSTTNAASPVSPASRYFLVLAKPWPPMSMASSSSLYRNATGTT